MQTKGGKWKEHELFLKRKVFPKEIVFHVCVNSVFNQNIMYVKMNAISINIRTIHFYQTLLQR